jgi:hypothetical protein
VARRVYLHVGTPKTGTTYLQTILWSNREVLRRQGVLFPGDRRVDHLYASLVIRGAPRLERRDKRAPSAWNRLLEQVRAFDGTAIISHEYFGPAAAEQAQAVIAALAPAEVHVVVTARDSLNGMPALWQEHVKFRSKLPLASFGSRAENNPLDPWGWRSMDAAKVLARWGSTLPPERVHVITFPPKGGPHDLLWRRFAGLVGIDADSCDISHATPNVSLGVVEVEFLRRVNPHLSPDMNPPGVVSRWLRSYLAGEVLAPRGGDRYGPDPDQEAVLRKRSVDIVDALREARYDVIGDLDDLLPPDGAGKWRQPDDVTGDELTDVGAATVARMLSDLRAVTDERDRLLAQAAAEERRRAAAMVPVPLRRRVRRRLGRVARRVGLRRPAGR